MKWRDSILDALQRLSRGSADTVITRQEIIEKELPTIIQETQTLSQKPQQWLSHFLQQFRDDGILEFVDNRGRYRLILPIVDVETFDGSEQELDAAIREGRIRFSLVETGTELVLERRRRGQSRLRELALANYSETCALCDEKQRELLVTSHIVPWADSVDGRGDLTNVIVLCRAHDSLFEAGCWSLADDLTVLRKNVQLSWSRRALLPEEVTFRRPFHHCPEVHYIQQHRKRHSFSLRSRRLTPSKELANPY
jgi:hypothetical protein